MITISPHIKHYRRKEMKNKGLESGLCIGMKLQRELFEKLLIGDITIVEFVVRYTAIEEENLEDLRHVFRDED